MRKQTMGQVFAAGSSASHNVPHRVHGPLSYAGAKRLEAGTTGVHCSSVEQVRPSVLLSSTQAGGTGSSLITTSGQGLSR